MKKQETPYIAHVFVCTNDRKGKRKSCIDNNADQIKSLLKDFINNKGWKGKIRVSTSGCLGKCSIGPNLMIYPQKIWFSDVAIADLDEIKRTIEEIKKYEN